MFAKIQPVIRRSVSSVFGKSESVYTASTLTKRCFAEVRFKKKSKVDNSLNDPIDTIDTKDVRDSIRKHRLRPSVSKTTNLHKAPVENENDEVPIENDGFSFDVKEIKSEEDLKQMHNRFVTQLKKFENEDKLKCKSCGIHPLQSENMDQEKYYKIPTLSISERPSTNYNALDSIADAEAQLLKEMDALSEKDGGKSNVELSQSSILEKKAMDLKDWGKFKFDCMRCHVMKSQSRFTLAGQDAQAIMSHIPSNGKIVNVLSIMDFPTSCTKEILQDREPKSIWYIVTKADLFYEKQVQLNRTGLNYIRDSLERLMGADPNKIFFVSSSKAWNIGDVVNKLPKGKLYFVGRANAGKSSLITAMLKSVYPEQDRTKVLNKKKFVAEIETPDSYHIPGYTRANQSFKLGENRTLIDTPGFFSVTFSVYKYMLADFVKKNLKYNHIESNHKKRYKTPEIVGKKEFNGDELYSFGGFFYLQPPPKSVFQVYKNFGKSDPKFEAKYKNIERAKELNTERHKELGNRYGVIPEAFDDLIRYVIPPFFGIIDIVIQDLGFISIKPTSSLKKTDGLYQIYVPKGVKVIVRESMLNFFYKMPGLIDETGNRLNKTNIAKRGVTRIRRVKNEDKLHFTELIEIPKEMSNDEAFALVCPKSDIRVASNILMQEKYPNMYWRKIHVS